MNLLFYKWCQRWYQLLNSCEKIPFFEHIFKELTLNIDMPETDEDIINLIKKEISSFNISKTLFNINLKGYVSDSLTINYDYIEEELKKDLLYIRIDFELTKKYNIDLIKEEDSIRGEFVRTALKELSDYEYDYILKVIEYGVERL